MAFDVNKVRADFPILKSKVGKYPLVYFDNGATAQKPQVVIDTINNYYECENANIHRGVHHLSQVATVRYEESRRIIQKFIHAKQEKEIIFTEGTTESINIVAQCFGKLLKKGDEIIITEMEHHSNIVPWQMIAQDLGLIIKYIPLNQNGELSLDKLDDLITERTKILALTHISNSLGTINPIKKIIEEAHRENVYVLIDAAQSLQHLQVNVQELDCDFLVFSGHKVFGPTGVGILYGKESLLNKMPPYQGGGAMIKKVTMSTTTYADLPEKMEAGTPNIAGGIGLGSAIKWLSQFDMKEVQDYESDLLVYAETKIKAIEGITIYGNSSQKSAILSFLVEGIHPYDIGTLLNQQGIAVRTGHHCTQPIMDFYGISGTIRASFSFYNTKEEVDLFITALKKAITMLK